MLLNIFTLNSNSNVTRGYTLQIKNSYSRALAPARAAFVINLNAFECNPTSLKHTVQKLCYSQIIKISDRKTSVGLKIGGEDKPLSLAGYIIFDVSIFLNVIDQEMS